MSVLGNLCRSLYLGAARVFKMAIFTMTILTSSLSLYYLGKSGCRFYSPKVVVATWNPNITTPNSEVNKPDNSPVFGTFNPTMCMIINIHHGGLMIPICIAMFAYLIVGTFCFKHHKNTLEAYIQNHRREFVFLVVSCILTLTYFGISCLLEVVIAPCGPCKDPATLNVFGKNMSFVKTLTWFSTFMWAGLSGVGFTTFCIFHELVKNKASGID